MLLEIVCFCMNIEIDLNNKQVFPKFFESLKGRGRENSSGYFFPDHLTIVHPSCVKLVTPLSISYCGWNDISRAHTFSIRNKGIS